MKNLIKHPAIMTHASFHKEIQESLGISDGLNRLSARIENFDDLIKIRTGAGRLSRLRNDPMLLRGSTVIKEKSAGDNVFSRHVGEQLLHAGRRG